MDTETTSDTTSAVSAGVVIVGAGGTEYKVGTLIGRNARFKVYEGSVDANPCLLIKIATSIEENGSLDREAFLLDKMRKEATATEEAYAAIKKDKGMLNYHFFFPDIVESITPADQGGRRVNVLSFAHIAKELVDLVPIEHLVLRDHVVIDPRTSAWIMGKLLKMLDFAHRQGISVGDLSGENILINREQHYVSVFDWSMASLSSEALSSHVIAGEISAAASEVILALGGNPENGEIPPDKQLEDQRYENFLKRLVGGRESNARKAGDEFYKLVWSMWPREFHPFTTYGIANSR